MTLKVDGTNGVLQAYDYQVLTTGFSYTFAAGVQLLLAVPAGTLATGTVTMPANPVDGMNITITSTQQITALTVNANTGQSIVGGGAMQLSAGGSVTFVYRLANTTWYSQNNNTVLGVNGQVFTTSGTFTVPAGASSFKVTVVGGGGNGGTASGSSAAGAGGGGGGAVAIKYVTGLTPGTSVTVTVGGVSGTSSFGAYCSATGGAAGANRTTTGGAAGGAGGTATGGDINIAGGAGGYGAGNGCYATGLGGGGASTTVPAVSGLQVNVADFSIGLYGNAVPAGSIFGRGGVGGNPGNAGGASVGYGSGGGGGGTNSGTARAGGAGTGGIVIVEW